MVRINLLAPRLLADQHLVAEYNEILMLVGYVRKYPDVRPGSIPASYHLGPGHILFFKNKLGYLAKRHEGLKAEMRRRGFRPVKMLDLSGFPARLKNDWRPQPADLALIRARLAQRLRQKSRYYHWYGQPLASPRVGGLERFIARMG